MENKDDTSPMYFAYLEIENVKCFGQKQILDLRDEKGAVSPWTLILGNNGLGKTTLLKCVTWMKTVEESDQNKKDEFQISKRKVAVKPYMDGIDDDAEYERLVRLGKAVKATVGASLTNGVKLGEIPKKTDYINYSIEIKTSNGKLEEVDSKLTSLQRFNSPKIYAYSASRHMELKNLDRSELFDPVSNLFSESGELYDASEQLLNQDYISLQENNPKGKETLLLEKIKQILVDLLPGISDTKCISIHAKERTVKIKTVDGSIPLDNLSLGYKTMVAWIVDLALKMLSSNPNKINPLDEPAVVIIDEIDLHLHPKWQRIIKEKLTNHFKKTQFICTAHSPFMAQSSETENLCVLQRNEDNQDEVIIENSPYIIKGWRIGQVITSDLFGVASERSLEIEKDINRRRVILENGVNKDNKKDLKALDIKLAELPIEIEENQDNLKLLKHFEKLSSLLKDQ